MRVFEEKQRLDQWWVITIHILVMALPLYGCYKWFVLKEQFGSVGPQDWEGIIALLSLFPLVLILFFLFKLQTTIDERGIRFQFVPFHRTPRTISWNDMKKCYTKTSNPILDHGGWGYKFIGRGEGMAFTIKGNKGIQIELITGKKILIGTQKPEEVQRLIDKYFKNERIQGG